MTEKHSGNCSGCNVKRGDLRKREDSLFCVLCDPEATHEERIEAVKKQREHVSNLAERSHRWETRFEALADGRSEDEVQAAMQAVLSEDKIKLLGWLGLRSRDFLGTGMSFQEWNLLNDLERFGKTFENQKRDEKNRRILGIIRLSHELVKIREVSNFSTAFGESCIEAVIKGDWHDLAQHAKWLTFSDEFANRPDERKFYSELWATFREIIAEITVVQRPKRISRILQPEAKTMLESAGWTRADDDHWELGNEVIHEQVMIELYEEGVRWHPKDDEDRGYWYMEDGGHFPRTAFYRQYSVEALLIWARLRPTREEQPEAL